MASTRTTKPGKPQAGPPHDPWPHEIHSEEAERCLLGSLLIDGSAVTRIRSRVQPDDCLTHGALLAACYALDDAGMPIDLITLTEYLRDHEQLEDAGGIAGVGTLANEVPTSENVEAYADVVANTGAKRRLLGFTYQVATLAVHEPDARVALTQAQALLRDLAAGASIAQDGALSYGELLDLFFADLLDRMERPDSGIRTGLPTLDTQLGGLEPGDLMYLCGRPGSGKSALGVTLATAIARRFRAQWQERQRERVDLATGAVLAADPPETLPEHVDIVTLEMRQLQQVRRIVAAATSVNTRVLKAAFRRSNGSVDVEGYQTVKARAYADKETLARTLHIDERPTTLENLRSKVLTAVATRRTSVVLIDQIDLFNDEPAPGRRREADETERISRFSRMLKQLANEANVIIVCLAQLNRNVESRQNKRPMLSDLRSSGRLEQDADIVLGLYRGAYYDGARARKEPNFAQFAELGLLKVRESEANVMVPLRYEGAFTRFSEWPEDWEWPADETRGMER